MIKYVISVLVLALLLAFILGAYTLGAYTKNVVKEKEYQFYRGLFVSCMIFYNHESGCREAVQRAKDSKWYETPDPIKY